MSGARQEHDGGSSEAGYRLLIIDDHGVVREGLEAMLSTSPTVGRIATAGTVREALELCESFSPEVVLLDVRMPECDGFQVLETIRERWSGMRVLMFSSSATAAEVQLARQNGAAGYLGKSVDRETLLAAMERVASGGTAFKSDVFDGETLGVALSGRELSVLRHLGRGLNNEELGKALGVSRETVKSHLKSVFHKLGVSNRAEAVARSYELGLLSPRG